MLNLTPFLKFYASYRGSNLQKHSPLEVQAKQLLKLVTKAKNTKIGSDYKFNTISNISDFQSRVPLRKYEDFWNDYWKDYYPVLDNLTWPGKVPYFALSSGTTSGTTKYIPVTNETIKSNTKAGLDLLSFHLLNNSRSKIFGGLNFVLGGSTALQTPADGVFAGDLSGISVKTLPAWARVRYFPPKALALISNWEEKIEVLANAAINQDIRMISGVPSWLLIFFKKLTEITKGKSIAEIFPNLELLVHGGVNFTPYYNQFKDALLGTHAELREVYPASEGFIAVADRGYSEGLRLILDHGLFYEFVPVEELDKVNPTRHWIGNIEKNVNYAIVLSNISGLWSYVLGDTVKFIDTDIPRILITGRTSYSLSAFGEHLIAEEVENAIFKGCSELNLQVTDYSVGAVYPSASNTLGGHKYIIEFDSRSNGLLSSEKLSKLSSIIDLELCRLNEDYEGHRAKGFGLNPPIIEAVKEGAFASWMKSRGKLGGQNKVPRLIADKELFSALQEFINLERAVVISDRG